MAVRFVFEVRIGRARHRVTLEGLDPASRAVWVVQRRLTALGLMDEGVAPVAFACARPREAVRRFERLAGLPVTGDAHAPATRLLLREQVRAAQAAGRVAPGVP